jgi:hypothetical protein
MTSKHSLPYTTNPAVNFNWPIWSQSTPPSPIFSKFVLMLGLSFSLPWDISSDRFLQIQYKNPADLLETRFSLGICI